MYYKAPKIIAKMLGLERSRSLFPDGSYLLWRRDFLTLGSSDSFETLIPSLGCRAMSPAEVRAEQGGAEPLELPEPTDPRVVALATDKEEGGES